MGLSATFDLPGMTQSAKYRAVGNGVPVPMAAFIAHAIRNTLVPAGSVTLCMCGCGRLVTGKQQAATAACRKRIERRRKRDNTCV
jgi:DNA (cytosine-5)-methyltransferase 1